MLNHIRRDAKGELLKMGDMIRVIGAPDLCGMSEDRQTESLPVFQYLVGKYKRIKKFDEHGFAWLYFEIRKGANSGLHFVAIEPYLLKIHQPRKAKLALKNAL